MARATSASTLPWLGLALIILIADQFTKVLIVGYYNLHDSTYVTSFFNVVRMHNTGAAFSFLAGGSGWQRWFFTALATLICGWLLTLIYRHRDETLLPAAFALIIGGAVGNVYDRLVHGAVVDFLHFHYAGHSWPAFNLADSAITVGVVLMLWGQFRHDRQPPLEKSS